MTLLASAGSKEQLHKLITEFYCGMEVEITNSGSVKRVSDGYILKSVRVREGGPRKSRRWKFEMVQE